MTTEEFRDKYREMLFANKKYRGQLHMTFTDALYLVEKIIVTIRDNDKTAALEQLKIVRSNLIENLLEYANEYG